MLRHHFTTAYFLANNVIYTSLFHFGDKHPFGEFLKELDMTEGRATGIPKILYAMRQNGSPAPEFEFDKDHTYFMCRLPIHPQAKPPGGGLARMGPSRDQVGTKSPWESPGESQREFGDCLP